MAAPASPIPPPRADADKKTIPAQIAAGPKQNGKYNVKLAEALYSYGMYPEAEAAARAGHHKGGATDPTEAPMVLGQALAAQGKYDDAIADLRPGDRRRSRHAAHRAAVGRLRQHQEESARRRGRAGSRREVMIEQAGRAATARPGFFLLKDGRA